MANKDGNYVHWSSRWTFVMAAAGSAVGLGNIWKFPYIVGENGGGAFVLVYLACILLVAIPVMIAEVLVGRASRTDPIDAVLTLAKEANTTKYWVIIGIAGSFTGLMIAMFYSIVAGWALDYVVLGATGQLVGADTAAIGAHFNALIANKPLQLLYHTLFILLTGGVVAAGVVSGTGVAVRILMPLLLLLLLLLVGYSMAMGDFNATLEFMFDWDLAELCPHPKDATTFSLLRCEAVLIALGHAFFTLSIGMCVILAYGSYMPEQARAGSTVLTVAALDTAIALLAGLAIFPLVFAYGIEPSAGPGLMFVSLPISFSQMPGGYIIGTAFFILLVIAGLSSSISLLEPTVAWLEKHSIKRLWGVSIFVAIAWTGGALAIYHSEVFDFLDAATSRFMLPFGGLLIALFVGWFLQQSLVRRESGIRSPLIYRCWLWTLRVIAPLGIIAVFADNLGWI